MVRHGKVVPELEREPSSWLGKPPGYPYMFAPNPSCAQEALAMAISALTNAAYGHNHPESASKGMELWPQYCHCSSHAIIIMRQTDSLIDRQLASTWLGWTIFIYCAV